MDPGAVDGHPGEVDRDAAHALLVRLAGRVPDDLAWRMRDWLASAEPGPVAALLPRTLLRHRIGISDEERALLVAVAGPHRLIDAVLPLPPGDDPRAHVPAFSPALELPDLAVLSALAVVRGHPGTCELRLSVRGPRGAQRVLLVLGADRPWELTGVLQRLLRLHGERIPCVEVLPEGLEPPSYHAAALAGSHLLWTRLPRTGAGDLPADGLPALVAPAPGAGA